MAKAKSNIFFCGNFVREADDSGILKCVAKYGNKLVFLENFEKKVSPAKAICF